MYCWKTQICCTELRLDCYCIYFQVVGFLFFLLLERLSFNTRDWACDLIRWFYFSESLISNCIWGFVNALTNSAPCAVCDVCVWDSAQVMLQCTGHLHTEDLHLMQTTVLCPLCICYPVCYRFRVNLDLFTELCTTHYLYIPFCITFNSQTDREKVW